MVALVCKLKNRYKSCIRVVTLSTRRSTAKPLLEQLHWLPVMKRTEFKIATIVYKAKHSGLPLYLNDKLVNKVLTKLLRSSDQKLYEIPRTSTKIGDRAFGIAAPTIWNSIPLSVRDSDSLLTFRKRLKTHFFSICKQSR